MDSPIYSTEGKNVGSVKLPENVFGVHWNPDLVKQVVDSLLSTRRKSIAHTKTRGEVRGGGKKPWKQKGTGRARHGSTRSPIWVGGGVAHGPRNDKNYERTVPKKMRIKALYSILSKKFVEGEVLFLDSVKLAEPKTKVAIKTLGSISKIDGFENLLSKKKNSAILAFSSKDRETERAFSNVGNVEIMEARNLDPISLLKYKYLIIENPEVSIKTLSKTNV